MKWNKEFAALFNATNKEL